MQNTYDDLTISDIFYQHYIVDKRKRRAADTVYGYTNSTENHVLPAFGELTIPQISRSAVQDWVDGLIPMAGSGGALKAYKCLRQIIRWSIDKLEIFAADPTRGIELPRVKTYKPVTLTQRRLKRLVRGFVGAAHEATLIIQAALGCRPGENYYLSWHQINWRTGQVPIVGSLQYVPGIGLVEQPTKTAKGERDGYLPVWALDRLHQIWIEKGRPKGRIIGESMTYQVAYSIQTRIKRLRLPKITMKNLRHTWGSIAARAGVPIQDVASMMGHSNIQTTYRYYYEIGKAAAKRAQRKVARAVLGKTCEDMYAGIELSRPQELPIAA